MKYYYLKNKRTNKTNAYAFDELDMGLQQTLKEQYAKMFVARSIADKEAEADHKHVMAAGICPSCYQLRPLSGICPNCQ